MRLKVPQQTKEIIMRGELIYKDGRLILFAKVVILGDASVFQ